MQKLGLVITTDLTDVAKTEFLGYTQLSNDAKVLAIIKNGERVKFAGADDKVVIVLDKTSSMQRVVVKQAI